MNKPLFVPLKTEYYNQFLVGEKTYELRLYGPRWNERVCKVGRKVLLSKGYTKRRQRWTITAFEWGKASGLSDKDHAAIYDCYGPGDHNVAVIHLKPESLGTEIIG